MPFSDLIIAAGSMSACLSRRSTTAAVCGWFAAERGRLQQISMDSCIRV